MIIEDNKFNSNQNKFQDKMEKIKNNGELYNNSNANPFVDDVNSKEYNDPTNTKKMNEKRLSMLNERYKNGLISIEDFHNETDKITKGK